MGQGRSLISPISLQILLANKSLMVTKEMGFRFRVVETLGKLSDPFFFWFIIQLNTLNLGQVLLN